MADPVLTFEGVIGFGSQDAEEAAHFFEHTLGLELAGDEGALRFYRLSDDVAIAVDASGGYAGQAPYLLFSSPDVPAASAHFVRRGCAVRELPWGGRGRRLYGSLAGGPHRLRGGCGAASGRDVGRRRGYRPMPTNFTPSAEIRAGSSTPRPSSTTRKP